MSIGNTTVTKRFLITLGIMLALAAVLLSGVVSPVALAEDGNDSEGLADALQPLDDGNKPARTIMIYSDGAASEEKNPVMTAMLKEYMATKFDRRDFRIIVSGNYLAY